MVYHKPKIIQISMFRNVVLQRIMNHLKPKIIQISMFHNVVLQGAKKNKTSHFHLTVSLILKMIMNITHIKNAVVLQVNNLHHQRKVVTALVNVKKDM